MLERLLGPKIFIVSKSLRPGEILATRYSWESQSAIANRGHVKRSSIASIGYKSGCVGVNSEQLRFCKILEFRGTK